MTGPPPPPSKEAKRRASSSRFRSFSPSSMQKIRSAVDRFGVVDGQLKLLAAMFTATIASVFGVGECAADRFEDLRVKQQLDVVLVLERIDEVKEKTVAGDVRTEALGEGIKELREDIKDHRREHRRGGK